MPRPKLVPSCDVVLAKLRRAGITDADFDLAARLTFGGGAEELRRWAFDGARAKDGELRRLRASVARLAVDPALPPLAAASVRRAVAQLDAASQFLANATALRAGDTLARLRPAVYALHAGEFVAELAAKVRCATAERLTPREIATLLLARAQPGTAWPEKLRVKPGEWDAMNETARWDRLHEVLAWLKEQTRRKPVGERRRAMRR